MDSATNFVNLDFLDGFTKGDTEKRNQYIRLYLKTAPQLFADLQSLYDRELWDDLYVKAHSLKPQVLYMGISHLSVLLVRIEELAKLKGNRNELGTIVKQAIDGNDQAMNELKQHISVVR